MKEYQRKNVVQIKELIEENKDLEMKAQVESLDKERKMTISVITGLTFDICDDKKLKKFLEFSREKASD